MRAKQFLGLYEAQQQLFEVEMSPSNLKKLANKIDGAKVGMEFEMYVPDVDIDTGDDDYEPEYEDSERYDENEPAVEAVSLIFLLKKKNLLSTLTYSLLFQSTNNKRAVRKVGTVYNCKGSKHYA